MKIVAGAVEDLAASKAQEPQPTDFQHHHGLWVTESKVVHEEEEKIGLADAGRTCGWNSMLTLARVRARMVLRAELCPILPGALLHHSEN